MGQFKLYATRYNDCKSEVLLPNCQSGEEEKRRSEVGFGLFCRISSRLSTAYVFGSGAFYGESRLGWFRARSADGWQNRHSRSGSNADWKSPRRRVAASTGPRRVCKTGFRSHCATGTAAVGRLLLFVQCQARKPSPSIRSQF